MSEIGSSGVSNVSADVSSIFDTLDNFDTALPEVDKEVKSLSSSKSVENSSILSDSMKHLGECSDDCINFFILEELRGVHTVSEFKKQNLNSFFVTKIQAKIGAEKDGIIGPVTLRLLNEYQEEENILSLLEGVGDISGEEALSVVLKTPQKIKFFQKRLIKMGYYGGRVDGFIGPQTFLGYEYISGIKEVPVSDEKMESEEEYRDKYGRFSSVLEKQLDLSHGIVNAIIKKESSFGQYLESRTYSKGFMQLTNAPFDDMIGKASTSRGPEPDDLSKVQRYRGMYAELDLGKLKDIKCGDDKTIGDTLNDETWEDLNTLQDPETSTKEIQNIFNRFRTILKGNKTHFSHTLNMIVGTVYLKMMHIRHKTINLAIKHYNGDGTIQSDGRAQRDHYEEDVIKIYKEEKERVSLI